MRWHVSHRCDAGVRPLADRHYNRQSIGADNFVPPGRCLVLRTDPMRAFWVTSWPFAEFVRHAWGGAWVCSAFRNEGGAGVSSDLIIEAVAATRHRWPDVPALGMITFVDASKVKAKGKPGLCYKIAGFRQPPCAWCSPCGKFGGPYHGPFCERCHDFKGRARTEGGLVVWQMRPEDMPPAEVPHGGQATMFDLA